MVIDSASIRVAHASDCLYQRVSWDDAWKLHVSPINLDTPRHAAPLVLRQRDSVTIWGQTHVEKCDGTSNIDYRILIQFNFQSAAWHLTLWRPLLSCVKASYARPLTSGHSDAQSWASECPDVKYYKWQLNPVWHGMLYSCMQNAVLRIHCVQKNTPTHIFFHISMNYLWI